MGRRILTTPRRILDDYAQYGAKFDGVDDYLTVGGSLTGLADGKQGTVVFAIKSNGDGTEQYICHTNNNYFYVVKTAANKLQFFARELTSGDTCITVTSGGTITDDGNWHTGMASWDLSTTTFNLYIDGVVDTHVETILLDNTIDYTRTTFAVGATVSGTSFLDACLSNFGFDDTYVDLTVEANRDAIVSTTSMLDPASDGTNYFTTQPVIMLQGMGALFNVNTGTGDDFTVVNPELIACNP